VALVQLRSRVNVRRGGERGGHQSPFSLVGRSILSTEPAKSAAFFVKYFGAVSQAVPSCGASEVAVVDIGVGVGSAPPLRYIFVKDAALPAIEPCPGALIDEVQGLFADVWSGKLNFTMWIENHDILRSFGSQVFDFDAAARDGIVATFGTATEGPLRIAVPYTLWTVQVEDGLPHWESSPAVPHFTVEDCNSLPPVPPPPIATEAGEDVPVLDHSTQLVADPAAAAKFSVEVLGAVAVESSPSCSLVKVYVAWPELGYEMHFVSMIAEQAALDDFTRNVSALWEREGAGTFDHYKHESLLLQVSSLDVYIERCKAAGVRYLLTTVGDKEEYALFMQVPKNVMTVQLRSSHVSVEKPQNLRLCSLG